MKNLFLLASLMLLAQSTLFAQSDKDMPKEVRKHLEEIAKSKEKGKVVHSLDTVYNKGEAVFLLVVANGKGMFANEWSLRNLANKEFAYINSDSYEKPTPPSQQRTTNNKVFYLTWSFLEQQLQVETASLCGTDNIAEYIVKNNLIKDDALDSAAVARFDLLNGRKYSKEKEAIASRPVVVVQQAPVVINNSPTLHPRSGNFRVNVISGNISFDGQTVGTITESKNTDGSKNFDIYNAAGDWVASAKQTGKFSKVYEIKYFKTGRGTVEASLNSPENQIAEWLGKKGVL